MASRSEVGGNRTIRGEEALGRPGGLEALRPPLPLAGGLVGVLSAIVQAPGLPMFDPRHYVPLRGCIALQPSGDDHAWAILAAFEELAEELLGGDLIPPSLHQDIEHVPVVVDGTPKIVPFTVHGADYFVQVLFVTGSGASAPKLVDAPLAKLPTPLPDGFRGDGDATNKEQLFDISERRR